VGCKHCGEPIGSNSDCVWCEKLRSDYEDDMLEQSKHDIQEAYECDYE